MATDFTTMMRFILLLTFVVSVVQAEQQVSPARIAQPLPIDALWQSELFRKTVTGSFGIDSRIEPRITVDEEFYLDAAAKKMVAKDRAGAIKALRECSLLAESPALLFALATFEFEAAELDSAVKHFTQALEKFPNFRDAHRNLAIVLVQQEKYDVAVKHLARATELGSRESLTMGLLAYCHAVQDHPQAALDAYRLAALTQPSQREWQVGQAQALLALKRPQQAVAIFHQLIDEDPSDLRLWLSQADNWIALQRPVDAIVNLEFAYRADELTAEAILSLGHLYLQNQLPDLAVRRYQVALRHAAPPSLARAVEALELLARLGEWEKAATLAEQIAASEFYQTTLIEKNSDRKVASRFHRQLALIELETGDAKQGEKRVTAWLDQQPLDGLALILLARFKEEAGSREQAEMLLERAEGLAEYAAAAHRAHGKLLVNVGDYEQALEHLQKSQSVKPSETLADYLKAVKELVN
ncbi:MAG: tetratricopeptide repeat protein [Verrucomicrobiales bacterium]|nr:tetratricopeptide repeat protein [Verrucomicrobiales bacterium]